MVSSSNIARNSKPKILKKTKIAIIGHKGFIGSELFKTLSHDFKVFGIDPELEYSNRSKNEECWGFGIWAKDAWKFNCEGAYKFLDGADIVIHCGAICGVDKHLQDTSSFLSNLQTDLEIAKTLKNTKKKVIYFSSSEVYGDNSNITQFSDLRFSPQKRSNYAIEKLLAERMLTENIENLIIVRPFNIVSPKDTKNVISKFFKSAIKNESIKVFNTNPHRNFLFVSDLVKIIRKMCLNFDDFKGGIYNIANSESPISIKELAFEIVKITHSKSKILFVEPHPEDSTVPNRTLENPRFLEKNEIFPKKLKEILEIFNAEFSTVC